MELPLFHEETILVPEYLTRLIELWTPSTGEQQTWSEADNSPPSIDKKMN